MNFKVSQKTGVEKYDDIIQSVCRSIINSRKKVLVIVDADDQFAGYNPSLKGKPNSCYFVYMSTNPIKMKDLYINNYSLVLIGSTAIRTIVCNDILKCVKASIQEFFILSNNESLKICFSIFKDLVPLASLCQDIQEFEKLCNFDIQNGKEYPQMWIKIIGQSGPAANNSEVIIIETIDKETYSIAKSGKHFVLYVRGLSGQTQLGPTKGNYIEIKNVEHLRLIKNWNTRMSEIGLDDLKLIPLIENLTKDENSDDEVMDVFKKAREQEIKSTILEMISNKDDPREKHMMVEYPWKEDFESWPITSHDKAVLRDIQRASLDEEMFKMFCKILIKGFDMEGTSNMSISELSTIALTNKNASKRLFSGALTGNMFVLQDGKLVLNNPFKYIAKYKYRGDDKHLIREVVPLT